MKNVSTKCKYFQLIPASFSIIQQGKAYPGKEDNQVFQMI